MSETYQEYVEPVPADPEQEIDRPAYTDAGDGVQALGPDADEDHDHLLNPPPSGD